jgi:hypothetical protein
MSTSLAERVGKSLSHAPINIVTVAGIKGIRDYPSLVLFPKLTAGFRMINHKLFGHDSRNRYRVS